MRARQWAHFLPLPFAASTAAGVNVARAIVVAAFALAYAYGLNAISDRATDHDARKNPLAGVDACPRRIAVAVGLTGLAGIALAATAGWRALASAAISIAASTIYSVGPSAKALPVIGTLLNAVIFAPLLYLAADGAAPPPAVVTCTFVALLLQNQLLHERADEREDAAARVLTTARAIGPRATSALVVALGAACVIAALRVAPSRASLLTATACVIVATASAFAARDGAARRRAHRWAAFGSGAAIFVASGGWIS